MVKEQIISNDLADQIVDRLILQFDEYQKLQKSVNDEENILAINQLNEQVSETKKLGILKNILNRLSDEMTFATPRIWMLYKLRAYANTNKEIETVEDFIEHCSPKDYICTKRYKFINEYISKKYSKNIQELTNESNNLFDLISNPIITNLESDYDFILAWIENEYLISNNKISKWKNTK
jgi:hydroxymethylpyrimidine pyrophosphatase-like HAD family hydrolase